MLRVRDPRIAAGLLLKSPSAVIAYPTETFYGLGARITEPGGIERIIRIKGRDSAKGMIVLAGSIESALAIAEADSRQEALLRRLWPGPLSVLLRARTQLDPMLAPSGKVAVRVSPHPLALALTLAAGPVTSTSANPSGVPPASTPEEIDQWGPDIDAVLDGGKTPGGLPSTLADLTVWPPRCLREGALPFQAVLDAAKTRNR
jgi:L-threonylcarbamoyladenylate synthase